MLTVVTGWSPAGWLEYGRIFLRSFMQFWPEDVELVVYGEDDRHPAETKGCRMRVEFRQLMSIPGADATAARYADDLHGGRTAIPGRWKPKDVLKGYSYRYDARKFWRQGLIPLDAATRLERGDLLCWLDGDVETTRHVPAGFIDSLLPRNLDVAYLGRGAKHSEIGFQLYRIPHAVPHLVEFQHLYASGDILQAREWHSAYAFDIARKRSGIRGHDLTPGGSGNVWAVSPLQPFMTHNKGERKIDAQRRFYASQGHRS